MRTAIRHFDLICLGGGPAGVPCARKAAAYGKKVCIIEKANLGGTCLNKGCTPKKIFHTAADFYNDLKVANEYGINAESHGLFGKKVATNFTVNWDLMQKKNRQFIGMVNQMVMGMCKQLNIEVINGSGTFENPNTIRVLKDKEEIMLEAENIVVATGGMPIMPKIPGIELAVTSDKFFEMTKLPESITIIGGGYIGIEIASCLNTFGVKTNVCMLEDSILPAFDSELSMIEMEFLKKKGIIFHPKTEIAGIEKVSGGKLKVLAKNSKSIEAEMVMMAVGRKPNTSGFGFEKAGIKLGNRGQIEVNEYEETSCKGIYAVGDVTGNIPLTPVAKTASKLLADRLFGPGKNNKEEYKMDYEGVASVAFSEPPIARCGMTEQEAITKYGKSKVKTYKHQGFQLYQAMTQHKDPFIVKIVCAEQNGKEMVVGINALGRNIDEMIVGFSIAMKKGLSKRDLERTVTVHPTGVEEFTNMF